MSVGVAKAADRDTLQRFVKERVTVRTTVHTDDPAVCKGMADTHHEAVNHSVGEYAHGMAHMNGMESLWPMLKRACHGTFHHLSGKHPDHYTREFAERPNARDLDTIAQMSTLAWGMVGKRLQCRESVA